MKTALRNLVAASKEARDVLAIAMQHLARYGCIDVFVDACKREGIRYGVGVRFQDAIAEAERLLDGQEHEEPEVKNVQEL